VAGTGVAGLNVALAAEDAGWRAVLHGAGTVPEGSAVPHALVNFRPSGDRGPLGHLRRAAFFHLAPYAAFAERGVEAVVSDARLRERWATERDVAHQWLGTDRVLVNDALSVDTHAFRTATLERIEHRADTLDAMPAPGILAAGLGSLELVEGLRLNPNRGQQDRVKLGERTGFERPLNFGRLLLPAKDQTAWLGASFDRSPPDDWRAPRGSDSAENLARLTAAFPESGATLTGESWVGLRATTPDHLPLTGWLGENLGVLTGLGSKGYLYAPILASCLIAEALGRPLPLETWVWQALHPHRFNPLES
jgi:tRNA 5-methylaminomethyl-2-thiouridine biosynthesis bifunctional protein